MARRRVVDVNPGASIPTGSTVFDRGRYEAVRVLGRSTYATVYEAHDRTTSDRVAVKVLSLATSHRGIVQAMFRKEVDALDGFDHPAVVRMRDHFNETEANHLGIVLDLVPGGRTLQDLLDSVRLGRETLPPIRWRIEQLRQLLSALEAAHSRSIIHRDIKPSNILIDRDTNQLKLSDFGIARLLEHYGHGVETETLRQFYTRPYAAPEQALRGEATFQSDLHAFALVTAALLSGQVPETAFRAERLPTFLAPLSSEVRDPSLHQGLLGLLIKLLNTEPSLRPRAPAIDRVLADLLERAADRPAVHLRITQSVRSKATGMGLSTSAVLDDLNDGMRARYETSADPRSDNESFAIRCCGRGLWGILRPDEQSPERLVLVDVGRNPPLLHARQRESSTALPFRLSSSEGTGGDAFVAALFDVHEHERRTEEVRRKKQSLLAISQFVLSQQRKHLMRLRVEYRQQAPVQRPARRRRPSPESSAPRRSDPLVHADYLRVRVLSISPWDQESDEASTVPEDWTEQLDEKATFLHDGRIVATFHAYDGRQSILTLRLKGPSRIPTEGIFECKNIALETSLKRQEDAIDRFLDDDCVNHRLGRLLLYPEENYIGNMKSRKLLQALQPEFEMQSLAERALSAEDFFFIQGPPGTGKTTVIAEIMAQILLADRHARILLTSQANEAVNNALDALHHLGLQQGMALRLLRDVSPDRSDDSRGFETLFAEWIRATRERSQQALALFERDSPPNAGAVRSVLDKWSARLDRSEDVRLDYAESVQVFGATCLRVPALWRTLREVRFDWVIVDEAAKATPAEVLVSLVAGRRFVLVGDHRQLPPFLDFETERDVRNAGFDVARARKSLFEELYEKVPASNRQIMRRQFRMHHSIADFVGKLYYDDVGGLETGVPDDQRAMHLARFDRPHRVFWINVSGQERQQGHSWWNQSEIELIRQMLRDFDQELAACSQSYTAGVIAAYAEQATRLQRAISPGARSWRNLEILVDTVDAFQGKQVDVLVYSLVRSGEQTSRFVSDRRRLNVAFSRAKRLLIVVGHRESARRHARLSSALDLIPRENLLGQEALA